MKKILCVAILLMTFCMPVACLKTHTELKAQYSADVNPMYKYFDKLNITSMEYEMVYPVEYMGKIEIGSMGPVDPRYQGVIFISEEEGKRLLEDYEWKKENTDLPDLGGVSGSVDWSSDWYGSPAFVKDVLKNSHDGNVRFNGKDTIIFSFGTT